MTPRDRLIRLAIQIDTLAGAALTVVLGAYLIHLTGGGWWLCAIIPLNILAFFVMRFIWHYTLGSVLFIVMFIIGGHWRDDG